MKSPFRYPLDARVAARRPRRQNPTDLFDQARQAGLVGTQDPDFPSVVTYFACDPRQYAATLGALGNDALAVGALRPLHFGQTSGLLARFGAHPRQIGEAGAERFHQLRHRARHVRKVIQLARHQRRVLARQDEPQGVGRAAFVPRLENASEGILLRGEVLLERPLARFQRLRVALQGPALPFQRRQRPVGVRNGAL